MAMLDNQRVYFLGSVQKCDQMSFFEPWDKAVGLDFETPLTCWARIFWAKLESSLLVPPEKKN